MKKQRLFSASPKAISVSGSTQHRLRMSSIYMNRLTAIAEQLTKPTPIGMNTSGWQVLCLAESEAKRNWTTVRNILFLLFHIGLCIKVSRQLNWQLTLVWDLLNFVSYGASLKHRG